MTPKLWIIAALGLVVWLAIGGAILWSIVAVNRGWTTTSHVMAHAGKLAAFALGVLIGMGLGFVAGHWWWPLSR